MRPKRCPLCRLALKQSGDNYECPECGHSEAAATVADVVAVPYPAPTYNPNAHAVRFMRKESKYFFDLMRKAVDSAGNS